MKPYIFIIKFITGVVLAYNLSCNSAPKVLYGANKERTFASKNDYSAFINEKYGFKPDYLFFADNKSYDSLLYYTVGNGIDYFFGSFTSDTVEFKKSDFLSDNESCYGRVELEIRNIKENKGLRKPNYFFRNNSFINIVNGQKLELNKLNKKSIVLVISHKLGRIHHKEFAKIERLVESFPDIQLLVLSLDNVYTLN